MALETCALVSLATSWLWQGDLSARVAIGSLYLTLAAVTGVLTLRHLEELDTSPRRRRRRRIWGVVTTGFFFLAALTYFLGIPIADWLREAPR